MSHYYRGDGRTRPYGRPEGGRGRRAERRAWNEDHEWRGAAQAPAEIHTVVRNADMKNISNSEIDRRDPLWDQFQGVSTNMLF